jgi:hypothetical protein
LKRRCGSGLADSEPYASLARTMKKHRALLAVRFGVVRAAEARREGQPDDERAHPLCASWSPGL